jgi:hypothetical protein
MDGHNTPSPVLRGFSTELYFPTHSKSSFNFVRLPSLEHVRNITTAGRNLVLQYTPKDPPLPCEIAPFPHLACGLQGSHKSIAYQSGGYSSPFTQFVPRLVRQVQSAIQEFLHDTSDLSCKLFSCATTLPQKLNRQLLQQNRPQTDIAALTLS